MPRRTNHTTLRPYTIVWEIGMPLWTIALLLLFCFDLKAADRQVHMSPALGVNSAFQFGPAPRRLRQAEALNLGALRDGILWKDVEPRPGQLSFDQGSSVRFSDLAGLSDRNILLLYPSSPIYAGGNTVTEGNDVSAFARYVAEVAKAFPGVPLEIGNEFNGVAFVKGPAKEMGSEGRAKLSAQYLAAISEAGVPKERIIGGAMHSIAGGFLWTMLDAGAGAHMGGVAIHPYTSRPEAYARQLEVLRRHPAMTGKKVYMTEFGTTDRERSSDYFWQSYCGMSLSDVEAAYWYSLGPRQEGYVPILNAGSELTPLGRTYRMVRDIAEGVPVTPYRPDPFTYGCQFGDRLLVLWGAPREVTVTRTDLQALRADMRPVEARPSFGRDRVLVLLAGDSAPPIDPAKDIVLNRQSVLADSFDQFTYPPAGGKAPDTEAIDRYILLNGTRHEFGTCPGQDRPRAPWVPYLCSNETATVLHDSGFILGGGPNRRIEIVHGFRDIAPGRVTAMVEYDLRSDKGDGVALTLIADEREIDTRQVTGKGSYAFDPVDLRPGTTLALKIGPGQTAQGDFGKLRLRISGTE